MSCNLLVYLAVCTYIRTFYSQTAILSCCCVYLNLASHNLLVCLAVSVNTNLICVTEPSGLSCCLCESEPNLASHNLLVYLAVSVNPNLICVTEPSRLSCCLCESEPNLASHNLLVYLAVSVKPNLACITLLFYFAVWILCYITMYHVLVLVSTCV